ncbi:MAG: ABC transporter ATP-binding protein [Lachnospiraceae bacterium]|nr:ABC transporter ATP-binding protein [Lachnospiraceae bacterium]
MSLITCEDLAFAYDGVTVLRHLTFKIEQGDYLCILGENGAGKSTLMKGLLGLKKPSAGTVSFGEDLRAREIGYLPQQTPVQKDFPASVREVVLSGCLSGMGMRPFYGKEEKERADRNMKALEITDLKDRCYRDLSGGQQQRVLLARALCATKKVILLDEPVAGLDPLVTINMYRLIERINKEMGITVIMVSHDMQAATKYASHILHLGEDRQLFFGTCEEYRHTAAYHSFMDGEKAVHIWKKAAGKEKKPRAANPEPETNTEGQEKEVQQ